MRKITMMDNLTLYINKSQYKIEIDEKFTSARSLDDIEDLEIAIPGFFEVTSFGKQDNKYFLVYDVPENYQAFTNAKHFERIIKLQLIQSLLDKDPLSKINSMTYLDLNNLFYKDFTDIKILYRSNGFLPYENNLSSLDQYKFFIFGFISNDFSYKKFLLNKENALKKENDVFLFAVNATISFPELLTVVKQELIKAQIDYYKQLQFRVNSKKKDKKRKWLYILAFISLLVLLSAGINKHAEKKVASQYAAQINAVQLDNKLYQAIASGDTNQAIKVMEQQKDSPQKIAEMLVNAGQYDQAIDIDKNSEEAVVEKLYSLGQQNKILSLKSNSPFMTTEKEIVSYDTNSLDSQVTLITNKNTLKRLGLAYVEHQNITMANMVQSQLNDKELGNYIQKAEIEIEIQNDNKELFTLQQENKASNQATINDLNNKILNLQQDLLQLEEKMGIDH